MDFDELSEKEFYAVLCGIDDVDAKLHAWRAAMARGGNEAYEARMVCERAWSELQCVMTRAWVRQVLGPGAGRKGAAV